MISSEVSLTSSSGSLSHSVSLAFFWSALRKRKTSRWKSRSRSVTAACRSLAFSRYALNSSLIARKRARFICTWSESQASSLSCDFSAHHRRHSSGSSPKVSREAGPRTAATRSVISGTPTSNKVMSWRTTSRRWILRASASIAASRFAMATSDCAASAPSFAGTSGPGNPASASPAVVRKSSASAPSRSISGCARPASSCSGSLRARSTMTSHSALCTSGRSGRLKSSAINDLAGDESYENNCSAHRRRSTGRACVSRIPSRHRLRLSRCSGAGLAGGGSAVWP